MARPKKQRIVSGSPEICYFKPRGIPMRNLSEVILAVDECEAIRLADLEGLNHVDACQHMGVSRATFGRILQKARRTVGEALICGKAIRVDGGTYTVKEPVKPLCAACFPGAEKLSEETPRCRCMDDD